MAEDRQDLELVTSSAKGKGCFGLLYSMHALTKV